jgi:hypothetical protein
VLTDFAQSVDIGRDWESETMDKITENFSRSFTNKAKINTDDANEKLNKQRDELKTQSQEIQQKIDENPDGDNDEFKQQLDTINKEIAKIDEKIGSNTSESGGNVVSSSDVYSETNNVGTNVYNINVGFPDRENGEIVCKAEDTAKRIATMRSGLMFQPAFFSGDKIDFVRRIEFLSKMTRPSAAPTTPDTGFAFTKAPVCHIKLGDWWDHDIIVNSVSYDYADAPWTLDPTGRVQPMWALVSINFNIIGPYGSANARPPLSTDAGGMFSPFGGV